MWRNVIHGKDEVLRLKSIYMNSVPIPEIVGRSREFSQDLVCQTMLRVRESQDLLKDVLAWLRHEYGVDKPPVRLREPANLDEDGFVREVRKACKGGLTPAGVRAVLSAWGETVVPIKRLKGEIAALERELSRLVEDAYGLTDEDRALMWRTAPPRMPIPPPPEFAHLAAGTSDTDGTT